MEDGEVKKEGKTMIKLWESPLYQRNDGAVRTYTITDKGKIMTFPSVTSVLGGTRDQESNEALAKWELDNPGVKEERAAVGTKLHEMIEARLKLEGQEQYEALLPALDFTEEATKMYVNYCAWLKEKAIKPHLIEGPVYWQSVEGWGFAGSVDLVADVNDDLCIIDHKSSKKAKKLEWIRDYVLQVSAYSKAVKSMYGKEIKGAYINVAREKGFQSFYLDYYQLVDGWQEFYERLKKYNGTKTETD